MTTQLGPQSLGSDRDYILGPIKDAQGNLVPFAGTEPISVTLWRSDGIRTAPLVEKPGSWVSGPGGTVAISINAADMVGLAPGDYALEVLVTAGGRPLATLEGILTLSDSPRGPYSPSAVPTVALTEERLLRHSRGLMALATMDTRTANGDNRDLAGPIVEALMDLGYPVGDLGRPSDADLAVVGAAGFGRLLALARIKVLEACLDNVMGLVEVQVGINRVALGDAARVLQKTLDRVMAQYNADYIEGSARVEVGSIQDTAGPPYPGTYPGDLGGDDRDHWPAY